MLCRSRGCNLSFSLNRLSGLCCKAPSFAESWQSLVFAHDSAHTPLTATRPRGRNVITQCPQGAAGTRGCAGARGPPASPAPCAHLGEVQLSSRAPGADDQVLGEEEALPLALLPQREGPQAPPRDFPLLRHRHLDEGPCETEAPSLAPPPPHIGGMGMGTGHGPGAGQWPG